jgi:hypothetical protein
MVRYHPKAKTLNPQGLPLKLADHWAIPPRLRQAIESTFLATTELFRSPLNYLMSDGIIYRSAFKEDAVFGAVINSFQFQWTGSCIANPEYEPENMLKTILHALASSESSKIPFLAVLVIPIWDDTPWNSTSIRGHRNIKPSSVSQRALCVLCRRVVSHMARRRPSLRLNG